MIVRDVCALPVLTQENQLGNKSLRVSAVAYYTTPGIYYVRAYLNR